MPRRKFYYGDVGTVNEISGSIHAGHDVHIIGTTLRLRKGDAGDEGDRMQYGAKYRVNCECGSHLRFDSWKLDFVDTPLDFVPDRQRACMKQFIRSIGGEPMKEREALCNQVEACLDILSEYHAGSMLDRARDIIRRRFGLTEGGRRETLQSIANSYGLTRERIRQISAKALRILGGDTANRHQYGDVYFYPQAYEYQ